MAIVRRRCDAGAARCNAHASGGLLADLGARMGGLPPRVPLSNEVRQS